MVLLCELFLLELLDTPHLHHSTCRWLVQSFLLRPAGEEGGSVDWLLFPGNGHAALGLLARDLDGKHSREVGELLLEEDRLSLLEHAGNARPVATLLLALQPGGYVEGEVALVCVALLAHPDVDLPLTVNDVCALAREELAWRLPRALVDELETGVERHLLVEDAVYADGEAALLLLGVVSRDQALLLRHGLGSGLGGLAAEQSAELGVRAVVLALREDHRLHGTAALLLADL
mmetsp:Transcript_16636/g.64963  ORF Transcript_16636/g.64963 Transcript_16636/m.64963 type:complete len:233 (-) Transcript_16636:1874-2572(-)